MKTIEEKAKAYDEAIRKLRGMMPNWERLSYNGKTFLQDLIYIIPELAESEDEKVIKEIIELVMQPTWKTEEEFHRRNVLCAWLENVPVTIDHEKREGFHLGYKACHEEQSEQEPEENKGNIGGISPNSAWSEEDEKILKEIISDVKFEGYNNDMQADSYKKINWLKSLRHQSQWKPSKEQIVALRWVLNNVPYNKHKEEISGLLDQIKDL